MERYLGFSIVGDTRRVSEIVSPLIRFCFSQSGKVNLFELTKDLVAIDSITGREKSVGLFLSDTLKQLKFEVELQEVEPERFNVLAFSGTPQFVFATHMDTVPPLLPVREDEERIYGRGSCDAKGIMAAQINAAERLLAEGFSDFGMLYLVGEEVSSDGARRANERPRGTQFVVMGEPTGNRLALGTKGALRVDITARGKMAHSAYPRLGDSAIEKLLDILTDLRKMPLPQHPVLGPTTYNIGLISGGRAPNVIPDLAEAQVLFRVVDDGAPLRRDIERILKGRCEFNYGVNNPALLMDKLDGFETDVMAFTTDLPSLKRWGQPLLLGPGSVEVAHTENEHVHKQDLVRAVDLYFEIAKRLRAKSHEKN